MQKVIEPILETFQAKLRLPGSPTISHRALFLAALADGVSEIRGLHIGSQINSLISALQQIGIVIQYDAKNRSCIIAGASGHAPKSQVSVLCRNKLALEYVTAICSMTLGIFYFDGRSHLRNKVNRSFLDFLHSLGAQLIPTDVTTLPFSLLGKSVIIGNDMIVTKKQQVRLASLLLMISPYADKSINLIIADHFDTKNIDLTAAIMADFGVLTQHLMKGHYLVPAPQRYQARDYRIEPDHTLAAYFLAAAAMTKSEIALPHYHRKTSKSAGIHKFLSLLQKTGCQIEESGKGIVLRGPQQLRGIDASFKEIDHHFLALTAILPFANSVSHIKVQKFASSKDIMRWSLLKNELTKLNIRYEASENGLTIYPSAIQPAKIEIYKDRQLGMALSLIGLMQENVQINNAEVITAYYPNFFDELDKLVIKHIAIA